MAVERIVRVLVYEGESEWIERTLGHSAVKPKMPYPCGFGTVKETFRGDKEEFLTLWRSPDFISQVLP